MKNIILIGGGGHCRACIDVIEQEGNFIINGIVDSQTLIRSNNCGYKVIGTDADLPSLLSVSNSALIAVGQIKSVERRKYLFNLAQTVGFNLPSIVSPIAYCSPHAVVNEGTILMHGCIINTNAQVGRNCIINSMALVEHDVTIEDHSHIATGAKINGGVTIREGSFIGSGAVIKEGVHIGAGVVVGAGLTIIKDVPDGKVVTKTHD